MDTLPRSVLLCGQVVLVAYLAYGVLGIFLELRAYRYRTGEPPRKDRYNPAFYAPEGRRWVEHSHRWHRAQWLVWLGGVAAVMVLCGLLD